jgi:hypothetical protein
MAKFNEHQVKEINDVIASINTALEKMKNKKCEIGARNKATLKSILTANKLDPTKAIFFKCKREFSDTILAHFITEKELTKSKFSMNTQDTIFLLQ